MSDESVEVFFQRVNLSPAEKRVCRELIKGISFDEAARILFLSHKTVKFHATKIYSKIGVKSKSELVAKFLGIIQTEFPKLPAEITMDEINDNLKFIKRKLVFIEERIIENNQVKTELVPLLPIGTQNKSLK